MMNTILEQMMATGMSKEQAMVIITQIEEKAIADDRARQMQQKMDSLGFLRAKREYELGLSIRQMADKMGITANAVSSWESFRTIPKVENLSTLFKGYDFFTEEEQWDCVKKLMAIAEQRQHESTEEVGEE